MAMKSLNAIPSFYQQAKFFWTKKYNHAIVKPGIVSPELDVPEHIQKPYYYHNLKSPHQRTEPEIKNDKQIIRMRDVCRLAANILRDVGSIIRVGITTDEIDRYVHKRTIENNAYPSPLRYKSFPKSICTSVNNVATHGIPDDRPLQDGDIINVDITVFLHGFHGDCSKTFPVGNVDAMGMRLINATERCVLEALKLCKPAAKFNSLGMFIERRAHEFGFGIVPCFLGHGIGEYFHGPPDIYHFSNEYPGQMQKGMTFTIEPVLTQGRPEIVVLDDNWTAVTEDNARTSQFEHTVLITDDGCEILTLAQH